MPNKKLPPIPSSVQGLAGPIAIAMLKDLRDENTNKALAGQASYSERKIRLSSTSPLQVQWTVLAHEMMHFALWDSGHETTGSDKPLKMNTEQICDLVGSAFGAAFTT